MLGSGGSFLSLQGEFTKGAAIRTRGLPCLIVVLLLRMGDPGLPALTLWRIKSAQQRAEKKYGDKQGLS